MDLLNRVIMIQDTSKPGAIVENIKGLLSRHVNIIKLRCSGNSPLQYMDCRLEA